MPEQLPVEPEDTPVDIAEWQQLVVQVRNVLRWSQEKLAREAGVSLSALARQEQGSSVPTPRTRRKVERALGIEGRVKDYQRYIEALRVSLGRHPSGRMSIQAAAALVAQLMESTLTAALADLQEGDEPSLEARQTQRLVTLLEEFRQEREERERCKAAAGRAGPS